VGTTDAPCLAALEVVLLHGRKRRREVVTEIQDVAAVDDRRLREGRRASGESPGTGRVGKTRCKPSDVLLLLFGSDATGRTAAPARRIAKERGSARAHLNIADVEVLVLADLLQENRVLHGRSAYLR
jgi:hypothetical protein